MTHAVALRAVRPTLRAVQWLPVAAGAALAAVVMFVFRPDGDSLGVLTALRVSGFLLAAGAALALDDPAAATLAPSPTTLRERRLYRLVPVCTAWAACWGLALVAAMLSHASRLPLAGATLEAAAMLAVALAFAAVAAPHMPEFRGGVVAAPALTLAMAASLVAQQLYPKWATLFALSPGGPEWSASRFRWIAVLGAAVIALAVSSLDPASRWRGRPVLRPHSGLGPRSRPQSASR